MCFMTFPENIGHILSQHSLDESILSPNLEITPLILFMVQEYRLHGNSFRSQELLFLSGEW